MCFIPSTVLLLWRLIILSSNWNRYCSFTLNPVLFTDFHCSTQDILNERKSKLKQIEMHKSSEKNKWYLMDLMEILKLKIDLS